jgi:hypothetical protein
MAAASSAIFLSGITLPPLLPSSAVIKILESASLILSERD